MFFVVAVGSSAHGVRRDGLSEELVSDCYMNEKGTF